MRRCVTNKSARCSPNRLDCQQSKQEKPTKSEAEAVIPSVKRQNEYQAYRSGPPERSITISSMPVLVGAGIIAAAILLSTLLSAIGTRYIGIEGPTEESAWLVDRLTGRVYRCAAAQPGKAACDSEIVTGSISERQRPRRDNPTP